MFLIIIFIVLFITSALFGTYKIVLLILEQDIEGGHTTVDA